MQEIEVANIKCGGCANSIKTALGKAGFSGVEVDPSCQKVTFDQGDRREAAKILDKMGYPEAGTKAAKNLLKKAKSYASCMVGRISPKK